MSAPASRQNPPRSRVPGRGAAPAGHRDEIGIWAPPFVTRRFYAQLGVHALAPSFARSHVERVLADIDHTHLTSTAQLVASELVTNAIHASSLRAPTASELEHYGIYRETADVPCIWIGLYPVSGGVVVEVWDHTRRPPQLTTATLDALGGRGLLLVDALSHSWGYHWPTTGGKVVWAKLCSEPATSTTDAPRSTETVR